MKKDKKAAAPDAAKDRTKLRRTLEPVATFGLGLVAAGLVAPFSSYENTVWLVIFKWIYAVGAVLYTVARIVAATGRDESFRVRRLRRMEAWAGIAFCFGAFFWFYNTSRIDSDVLTFRMLNETIIFTLAGALIQIISSWMLSSALRKGQNNTKQ